MNLASSHISAIRIQSLSAVAPAARWRFEGLRARDVHAIVYVTRGHGKLKLGTMMRGLSPNSVAFIPAGIVHGIVAGQNFGGTLMALPPPAGIGLPEAVVLARAESLQDQAELAALIGRIGREAAQGRADSGRAIAAHATLLGIWLARRGAPLALAPTTRAERIAAAFLARVEVALHSGDGAGAHAAALGITPTHLTRVCREVLAKSATEILAERRMLAARMMLSDTALSAADIARALGYSSPQYFSRQFAAAFGRPPQVWRNDRDKPVPAARLHRARSVA